MILTLSVYELQFGQGMGMGCMRTWMGIYGWMPLKLTICIMEEEYVDMDLEPLQNVVLLLGTVQSTEKVGWTDRQEGAGWPQQINLERL